jgi:hypothetical protein
MTEAIEAIEGRSVTRSRRSTTRRPAARQAEEDAKLEALREEIAPERGTAGRGAEGGAGGGGPSPGCRARRARRRAQRLAEERRIADEKAAAERAAAEAAQRAERERDRGRTRRRRRSSGEGSRQSAQGRRGRRQAEREEAARQAHANEAEQDAKERAERERIAAEEARVAEAERQAELAARLEALKPDAEKVRAFAEQLAAITPPAVSTPEAQAWVAEAMVGIDYIVADLRSYIAPGNSRTRSRSRSREPGGDPVAHDIRDHLRSIDASMSELVRQKRAAAPKPVASDRDLDGKYGNPVLKFNPRDWNGAPFKNRRFSECPPDLLDLVANTFDWFAEQADQKTRRRTTGSRSATTSAPTPPARAAGRSGSDPEARPDRRAIGTGVVAGRTMTTPAAATSRGLRNGEGQSFQIGFQVRDGKFSIEPARSRAR